MSFNMSDSAIYDLQDFIDTISEEFRSEHNFTYNYIIKKLVIDPNSSLIYKFEIELDKSLVQFYKDYVNKSATHSVSCDSLEEAIKWCINYWEKNLKQPIIKESNPKPEIKIDEVEIPHKHNVMLFQLSHPKRNKMHITFYNGDGYFYGFQPANSDGTACWPANSDGTDGIVYMVHCFTGRSDDRITIRNVKMLRSSYVQSKKDALNWCVNDWLINYKV